MKLLYPILLLWLFNISIASAGQLQTVDYVDPNLYVGRWYQISHNQMPFEPQNCMCAQQTLALQTDGTLSVYNSCNDGSLTGPIREIHGVASNNDPLTNAQFTVDFGLPQKGQYWIIGLAADYHWAVVSDPSGRSLYILSKTPTLSAEDYQIAVNKAEEQVSTQKLKSTIQVGCAYPL